MNARQLLRFARRSLAEASRSVGEAGVVDPLTGQPVGALDAREAVACGRATLGAHSYGSFTVHVGPGEDARLRVGSYCSIARDVDFLLGGNHRSDWVSTYPFRAAWGMPGALADGHPRREQDIVLGSDVWIGTKALILAGVRIGDGAVVGAGAVVARDVRPYAVVVGSPAREIRRRFDDGQVERLLALRWWDWPEQRIRASVDLLCSPDVERLLSAGVAAQ